MLKETPGSSLPKENAGWVRISKPGLKTSTLYLVYKMALLPTKLGLPTKVAPLPWIVRALLIVVSQPPLISVAPSTLIDRPGVMLIVSAPRLPLA
jgi:hypothetical protein